MKLDDDQLRKLEPTIHTKMNYAKIAKKTTKSTVYINYLMTLSIGPRNPESDLMDNIG